MRRLIRTLVVAALFMAPGLALRAQVDARLLRYPAVSATEIAFVYGGDIWVVAKAGGLAQRLSSPRGEESFPRFSPDGSRIAFTGNYDGNQDIYVIPAMGGLPKRVTHHPAPDRMLEWTPDGKRLLFASSMTSEKDRFNKLFEVAAGGGLPEQLPLPYGEFGALSPDSRMLAYTPHTRDFRTWKRYRGGLTDRIWLFDLEKHASKQVPSDGANDTQPMWHGSTVYFLSDRGPEQRYNVWTYDTRTGAVAQVTKFADYDVHFPSIGPSEIVFENGGRLYLLPLAGGEPHEVDVAVVTDRVALKPRVVKVGGDIQSMAISPTGRRALFEARGDVFTVPAEHGLVRDLTARSGSAERYPAWSPDGRRVAWFSDRTGEYELTVAAADGSGEERTVSKLGAGFRGVPYWSPDSRSIVFADHTGAIHVMDVATGADRVIDRMHYNNIGDPSSFRASWSPDSRWIAWGGDLENTASVLWIYDTKAGEKHQATSGFYSASSPVFDVDGKYLFFLSSSNFDPSYSDIDNTWIYANSTVLAAVPLRNDVPSPLAPRNDEEPVNDGKPDSANAEAAETVGGGAPAADSATSPVTIDFDGFERRMVVLPPEPGNFADLQAASGKVLYRRPGRTGAAEEKSPIVYYDLEEREEKTVLDDAQSFRVSADGLKLLVAAEGDRYAILDVKPAQKIEKTLATADMEMTVDPMAEWKQIFADAWRFERDMFYASNMHGVDWPAMREHYGALLEQAGSREDVNYVIGELIGELSTSHTYRGGGDLEQAEERAAGMLGADFSLENGAYRIARIVDGAAWDAEVRSPLSRPGLSVKAGDYLLAVNGQPLDPSLDPWAALQGLAGRTISLMVNDRPTADGARQVLVKALSPSEEARLRNLAWIESNRQRVDRETNGRVGYIYVPSTGIDGQTELVRQYAGQWYKDGLIIDERFNNGGQIPDRFVELLGRKRMNYWGRRDGMDWPWPFGAHEGAEVMLINEWSGSGGDAFPFYFKEAGLGPLIGKRTWGGLVGISGSPPLVDGGSVTVPSFGIYSRDGEWIIENHGVEPDIEVENDPALMVDGGDPQLERAIAETLRILEEDPPVRPKRPADPVKAGPRRTAAGGNRKG